jgi:hypothetical protein
LQEFGWERPLRASGTVPKVSSAVSQVSVTVVERLSV